MNNIYKDNAKEIHEAILNDSVISALIDRKMELILNTPTKYTFIKGELEMVYKKNITEALGKIDQLILSRQEEIKRHFKL